MIERVEVQVSLGDEGDLINKIDRTPLKVLLESVKTFTFVLCRKEARLGKLRFPQFWMERASVYGTGQRAARNRSAILDFAWWYGMQTLALFNDGYLDSFVLAHLFDRIRRHGAQRVFANAVLSDPRRVGLRKQDLIAELDNDLAKHRNRTLGVCEFRDESAKILGPAQFSDEMWKTYYEFATPLFVEARKAINEQGIDGVREPISRWNDWMSKIARRSGHEIEKQVLDVFSHESSAALNRCYTTAWYAILKQLTEKYGLSAEAVTFHEFWHLDQYAPSGSPGSLFHLFHGHVLSLHPGAGMFLSTATGAEIMGEWVQARNDMTAYGRLLNGLFIAIGWYARQRAIVQELRKKDAKNVTNYDLEAMEDLEDDEDDEDDEH